MKKLFLQIIKGIAFSGFFLFLLLIVPLSLLGKNKEKRIRTAAVWTRRWAKGCAAILRMKITLHGNRELLCGKLVISNHTGPLDIIAQGSLFDLRFAPKAEMKHWPVFGWLTALSQPVWIDRKNRTKSLAVAKEIAFTMEQKLNIIVYPEGTTTDGKSGLLDFKSTAFEPAIQAQKPVVPVLIFHRGIPEGQAETAWHGNMGFLSYILGIPGLKEIHSCMYIMPEVVPLSGEDRKDFARRVHDMMEDYFWRIKNDIA